VAVLAVQQAAVARLPPLTRSLSEGTISIIQASSSFSNPLAGGTTAEGAGVEVEVEADLINKIVVATVISNDRAEIVDAPTILFAIAHKDSAKHAETEGMIDGLNSAPIINPDYMVRSLRFSATKIPPWS
jgi:hypothetical protein